MQMQNVDVVIVGGGMVGLGLAAALKESGLKIAIVEGQLPDPALGDAPDNRVSALSLASQRILQQVGAWAGIEARRLQPYDKMQVWEQDSFGQIGFDAASLRQAALGHIVENRVIQLALLEAILGDSNGEASNISLLSPARAASLQSGEAGGPLLLGDGRAPSAKLGGGAAGAPPRGRRPPSPPPDGSTW
ncbi:FAD-dependent monooxygenase, partial [Aeromonas salmonicida]|uniref:FAD-dependent monooxygenase n=1 Tax=Aeromonas salmonicida TaxID=645 RepID=UPI003D011B4D